MAIRNSEIAERLKGIRLLSDVSVAEMARELHMTEEEYSVYLKAMRDFLESDIIQKLDGAEYAKNIYHVIRKRTQPDFHMKWKEKLILFTGTEKSRISAVIKKAVCPVYHRIIKRR